MAKLKLFGGDVRKEPFMRGDVITFGSGRDMVVKLRDPRPDPPEGRPDTPGAARKQTVSTHIASISVGEKEVQLRHQSPGKRDHAVFVIPDGGAPSVRVDYDCVLSIHGSGQLLIRDSPGKPRGGCWPDFRYRFEVSGVRVDRTPSEGLFDKRATQMTAVIPDRSRNADLELGPNEIDYVTALGLPWLTGRPEYWMSVAEISQMWSLGENTLNEAMKKLRGRMAETDPPLWDAVNDDRFGANIAAAGVLVLAGMVTLTDVEQLNLIGYVDRHEPARRTEGRRRRRSRRPTADPGAPEAS